MGCRLARAYASAMNGELPSVRITLPIDMKNLFDISTASVAVRSAKKRVRPKVSRTFGDRTQTLNLTPACTAPESS
jgi:hypothetical protein